MQNDNERKYLDALIGLKSDEKNEMELKVRLNPTSLDLIENLMSKMEWSLGIAINSCLTHTLTISEDLCFSDFAKFNLDDNFEPLEFDLSVKNQNRISDLAKANAMNLNERFISYILAKSIDLFQEILLKKDEYKNAEE